MNLIYNIKGEENIPKKVALFAVFLQALGPDLCSSLLS